MNSPYDDEFSSNFSHSLMCCLSEFMCLEYIIKRGKRERVESRVTEDGWIVLFVAVNHRKFIGSTAKFHLFSLTQHTILNTMCVLLLLIREYIRRKPIHGRTAVKPV